MTTIRTQIIGSDARVVADRRRFSWRTVCYGFTLSRRHRQRRADDDDPVFIDWHHPWLFLMSVGIMVMSSMDAFFTLQLLELGAMEVNPIMDAAINKGTLFFAVSKMLLTAFGVLMLVFLAKARFLTYFRAGVALTVAFSMYACLVCYEFVFLLSHY